MYEKIKEQAYSKRIDIKKMLTHVQLTYETGHVVVFEKVRQYFTRKSTLIKHVKAKARLIKIQREK